jgi:hypothetical protein
MIHTGYAVRILQTVACIVGASVVLWSLGIPTFIRSADAASLTTVSDTISNSDRGVVSNHTIRFTTPSGILNTQTIDITFPAGFTLPGAGFDFNDVDVVLNGSDVTLAGAPSGTTWGVSIAGSTITLTTSTSSGAVAASSSVITVRVGTNATVGSTGDAQITNPSTTGSYEISIGGSMADSGSTRVAIIDNVDVTASVDTTFTFTISGVATSSAVNGGATSTTGSTTATAVPFGNLTAGTTSVLAQDLSVTTNAANGFVVTVAQSQNLLSSTGADIDGFANGAYTNTPTAWTSPSAQVANEATWGHWGLTSEDDLNTDEFGTDLWVAASTTPRQIFQNNGPSDGVTANSGRTRVGYQAQVSSLQEAGDDYTTTLTYVATPTF